MYFSHCAVRARNGKVLLAVCFDKQIINDLSAQFEGQIVSVAVSADASSLAFSSPSPGSPVSVGSTVVTSAVVEINYCDMLDHHGLLQVSMGQWTIFLRLGILV